MKMRSVMRRRVAGMGAGWLMMALTAAGLAGQASVLDTVRIEEVVVTGSPVKVNRNSVPMAVSVVDREHLEESGASALLPVLNGKVPGLFVTERGVTGFGVANGSAGQISIRGVGGSPTTGVLMLIDGHPQFMGIMGHPLPDAYVASDAERVEVIRGPASILYGSNAMGGVVNIITKKQVTEGFNGNARISYGSFNTMKYMASAGYKKDKLSLFVSGNHDNTDGHRPNSDFKITNGYLKLAYDPDPHWHIYSDVSLAAFKASDPGPDTLNALPGEKIDITRGYWAFTVQNEYERLSGAVKVFYNFGEHNITDGFHSTDHNYGVNVYEAIRLFKGNNLTLGVDHMRYGGLAENLLAMGGQGIQFADTTVHETGIYGFMQQQLFDRLTLNGGIRHQYHSVYGDQWIPSAGFALALAQNSTWKGNVSKGFRSPTIRELFLWGPNPALDPETVLSVETGLAKSFAGNRLRAELTLFSVQGDNLIVTVPMQGLQNAGEVNNRGVEMMLHGRPFDGLQLDATYSFTDMENPVYATPEHHLYLEGRYQWKRWLLSGNVRRVINLDSDPGPGVADVDYTLLEARVQFSINKNLNWYLSGENLLNTTYAVNRYYTMPGATFFTGINLRL